MGGSPFFCGVHMKTLKLKKEPLFLQTTVDEIEQLTGTFSGPEVLRIKVVGPDDTDCIFWITVGMKKKKPVVEVSTKSKRDCTRYLVVGKLEKKG